MALKIEEIIDWRAFNYLLDKITRYEDGGHTIDIKVCITTLTDHYTIYWYNTGMGVVDLDELIGGFKLDRYIKTGLVYDIICSDCDRKFADDLYSMVDSKFDRVRAIELNCLSLKIKK